MLSAVLSTGVKDRAKFINGPRTGPTGRFSNFLTNHGDSEIENITIARKPIISGVKHALNVASFGAFNKVAKALNYNNIYHNFAIIETKDGRKFKLERNHITEEKSVTDDDLKQEHFTVPVNKSLSINQMIQNASKDNSRFWSYDASNNNCQNFTESLIKQNGLDKSLNDHDKQFLEPQNGKALVGSLGIFAPVTNLITNAAGSADILMHGKGFITKHISGNRLYHFHKYGN